MQKSTRQKIFELEIFKPSSGTGYGLDAMLIYSDEIAETPSEELIKELTSMEVEELIEHQDGYYRSTTLGQIAYQRFLAQSGALQEPLVNQKQYNPDDLILAIVASHEIDPFSSYNVTHKEALEIYLHEFPIDEVHASIERLITAAFIAKYDFGTKNSINLTGTGYQRYLMEVRQRLNLPREVGILSQISQVLEDERFNLLGFDASFCENIKIRWFEMEACANTGAYLASVILLGSILEGILLSKLQNNIKSAMMALKAPKDGKSATIKILDDWSLQDYIAVAVDLGYLPKSVEKHIHELRDSRNLVHPNKQIKSGIIVDESLYRISREVAETIIDALVIKPA